MVRTSWGHGKFGFCRTLLLQRFVGASDLAFQSLSIHIPRTGLLILLLEVSNEGLPSLAPYRNLQSDVRVFSSGVACSTVLSSLFCMAGFTILVLETATCS